MSPIVAASHFLTACPADTRLLVAVSGGSDSLGLLYAFHHALTDLGRPDIQLHAATIDHALRPGSDHEALKVANTCEKLKIPHHIRVWTGEKPQTGIPAAARLARYTLLSAIAKDISALCILTGHTLNDQAETIAMRATRSGDDAIGLSGMAAAMLFERQTLIARPFLSIERKDIRDFLIQNQVEWIDDPTNENFAYERARVRDSLSNRKIAPERLVPVTMRRELGAAVASFLTENAEVISNAVAVIDWDAARQDRAGARAIAVMLAVMGGKAHVPGRDQLSRVSDALAGTRSQTLTVSRAAITFRKGKIYITRETRNIPSIIVPPGKTVIWDDRFKVTNLENFALSIGALNVSGFEETDPFAQLPAAVANRARSNALRVTPTKGGDVASADPIQKVQIEPYFPMFDHFLPVFDLDVANCVNELFQRPAILPFVLHYI